MDTGARIGVVLLSVVPLAFVGLIVWAIATTVEGNGEKRVALDACWQCGWGRVEYVQEEYRCLTLEDGAEAVRTIEWVQENACNVLER